MNLMQAIQNRHSVRRYTDQKIEGNVLSELRSEIDFCNKEGKLHIQLTIDEPDAFGGRMAHYGSFRNVKNYIALVGRNDSGLDENIGYYGERIALKAQLLGLNTCWVALTFSKRKSKYILNDGEKLVCVLALGYGVSQGMDAVMLAPTATNQQKFRFTLLKDSVKAEATGGFYSKVDLGIVKYHFEVGAGDERFRWTYA